jgi:hypothetical protein
VVSVNPMGVDLATSLVARGISKKLIRRHIQLLNRIAAGNPETKIKTI